MDKQKKKRPFQRHYNAIEQLIREAYGLSPEQMEMRMEWAEKEAASEMPLGGRKIPQAPEHEFRTILSKMKERGITPRVMADFSQEQQKLFHEDQGFFAIQGPWLSARGIKPESFAERGITEKKEKKGSKRKLLFLPLEAAGAVAVCFAVGYAVFALRPGIDVMGKRSYEYISEVREGDKTDIVWNNQEDVISDEGSLEEAYSRIRDELGLRVLKVNYLPANVKLSRVSIASGQARLTFAYADNYMYVMEVLYSTDNSGNRFLDSKAYLDIFNEWLELDIPIQKTKRIDGQYEYSAYIEYENAYYFIQAVLDEEEFVNVIENISF
ncbi:MAG TPA: DUF4367 domain-containing protein [Candidatus Cottocaccamicrobium excrementipullorum]|nr:DUF4367 domain-containing protein [Candidatus Cottocaccamicrobium excrementipullorum]